MSLRVMLRALCTADLKVSCQSCTINSLSPMVGPIYQSISITADPVVSGNSNCRDSKELATRADDKVTVLMTRSMDPFRFLLMAVAGWMNQQQLQLIDYLREENRVLREQMGEKRLRFNDDQRRRLAARAKE